MKKIENNRGFTLLLASLIASLLATIGLAMFAIAQKEIRLSSMGRESQFAFYAADTGAECALFLNYVHNAFATSTTFTDETLAKCDGEQLIKLAGQPTFLGGPSGVTQFKYNLNGVGPTGVAKDYCVSVRVEKDYSNGHERTQINSLGYNVACSERATSNRTLERSVQMNL